MATKRKAKAKAVFVLPDGSRYNVIGESGKFVFCEGGVQFRRSRGEISNIPVAKESETEEEK